MYTILCLLIVGAITGFPIWLLVGWLPRSIDRAYERQRIYGDDNPIFKLKKGVLTIDWRTFGLSPAKRFFAQHFPKIVIVLQSGKELYFYNGIQGKAFAYEGEFSLGDELQYHAIEEHIR